MWIKSRVGLIRERGCGVAERLPIGNSKSRDLFGAKNFGSWILFCSAELQSEHRSIGVS